MEVEKRKIILTDKRPEEVGVCAICGDIVFAGHAFWSSITTRIYCIDCVKKTGCKPEDMEII